MNPFRDAIMYAIYMYISIDPPPSPPIKGRKQKTWRLQFRPQPDGRSASLPSGQPTQRSAT